MILKAKRKVLILLLSTFILLFFAFLSGWVIRLYWNFQAIPSDHLIGNKTAHVKALKENGFPFSFLVIGDTEGGERGEILIKKALRNGRFSFVIHLGDLVKKPDIWGHRFFLMEMIYEIRPPFPVFLVPGNHDIDYTSKIVKEKERRVTKEVFDSLYGARNFDFIFNHCLFILTEVDPMNPSRYLNYLRKVLSKKGKSSKYIFVFIHYPPKGVEEFLTGSLPNEEEFFSILETYKVTTCFFGHYHGYWRGERKGVNLVVAGGGGRLKKRQSEWGKFHHILKVTVDEHIISENLLVLGGGFGFEKSFENWVFTQLFPTVQNRIWVLYVVMIIFLASGICSFFFSIESLKKEIKKL